ncbi:MAG: AEC family transporter [Anaerolineae bacterium]|nr:AEC family transporter [Anaerolineae bacterium]
MDTVLATINVMLPVFLAIGLAMLFGKYVKVDPRTLSHAVIYLFGPCLILNSLLSKEMDPAALLGIFAMSLVSTLLLVGIGWVIAKILKVNHPLRATIMLAMSLGNTGSVGLPLAEFAFGAQGMQYAAVFYVTTTVFANILGVLLPSAGQVSFKEAVVRILKVPMIYAAVIGVVLNLMGVQLPTFLERTTDLLGYAAVACGIAFMGVRLANMQLKGKIKPIIITSIARVAITPFVGWLTALVLNADALVRDVSILQISVPTALFTAMFSEEFGGDSEAASGIILLSSLLSFISLSAIVAIMIG